jgi:hypothetical protein
MSKVTIKDLNESKSLDRAAMSGVRGGCNECEEFWIEFYNESSYYDEDTSDGSGGGYEAPTGMGTNNFYAGRMYEPDLTFVGTGMSFV